MFSISGILGLIFPGMMLLPISTAGNLISFNPVLGPEFNNLKSLAILVKSTAMRFKTSEISKKSVALCVASIGSLEIFQLTLVNFLGLRISSAGVVAFLMLIGYSVDTDILLTNKVLKSNDNESLNQRIFKAFRTGIMMTLTSITAVAFALIIIRPFSSVLNQIFTILAIGLGFDLINTWITNVSILKWYKEKKK